MASAGPVHRVQSAQEVYGFPQGHLGHLTPEEEAALESFKAFLSEKGLYKHQNDTDDYRTQDDATLLRFLRARRFIVQDAYQQFKETEDWRNANQLDILYKTIDVEHYDETRRLYPQWTGRRDRRGIPVYVYEVKHLNSKTMAAYEKSSANTHSKATTDGKTPSKLLRLFALYENLLRFVLPLCTLLTDRENPNTPITQSNNIVDISGVGLKQFWNLRVHMQDASTLATAHYPETLDRIFIIGAPAFFPTVWGWIKRWFDPITTSKIFILSSQDMQKTLQQFIDPQNIPTKYGGELDFKFGDLPVLDPALKDLVTWEGSHKDFPLGPLYWHDKGDYVELEAVGSVNKIERKEMVCKLKKPTPDHVYSEKHGAITPAPVRSAVIRPDLLTVPTEKEIIRTGVESTDIPPLTYDAAANPTVVETMADKSGEENTAPALISFDVTKPEAAVVEAGELVPSSRPEPVSFFTARDNLGTLSIADKSQAEGDRSLQNGSATKQLTTTGEAVATPITNNDVNLVIKQPTPDSKPSKPSHQQHETTRPSTADSKADIALVESFKSETTSSKKSASLKTRILGKLKH